MKLIRNCRNATNMSTKRIKSSSILQLPPLLQATEARSQLLLVMKKDSFIYSFVTTEKACNHP